MYLSGNLKQVNNLVCWQAGIMPDQVDLQESSKAMGLREAEAVPVRWFCLSVP